MIKEGDKVQWLVNGADQFLTPKKVTKIVQFENNFYVYVEDSLCAIPIEQLTKIKPKFIEKIKTIWSYVLDQEPSL
jgi:nitrate/TMAO reductase-like tetraheme cytochrome c subunit